MAIQPIDLQNMYSQLSNVAKNVAGAQQAAVIAESVHQHDFTQKNMEKATRVQSASDDKANMKNINSNGRNHTGYQQNKKSDEKKQSSDEENPHAGEIKASYLGTIIDLTR